MRHSINTTYLWVRFFGFTRRKPVLVYNRWDTQLIWITWQLTGWAHYRHSSISPNFDQSLEAARPVSPLNCSYHKVMGSTVAKFLLDCSGLLPISSHVIGVSRRCRGGSVVLRFGAKETQPLFWFRNSFF